MNWPSFGARPLAAALVCLSLATTACVPETETWLSDPATARSDPRLIGSFFGSDTGRDKHLIVTEAIKGKDGKPSAALHLVWAQLQPDNDEKTVVWASYRAWPARLPGGLTALNLERIAHGPHTARLAPRRFFVLYFVGKDGSVRVLMPRNRPWSAAIQTGALAGRVNRGRYLDQITVTASRAKLARFIADNAPKVFESPGQVWRPVK